jgi:hypothetical protein
MSNIQTLYIDTNKDVKIRSYFSNKKGVKQVESLGNNATSNLSTVTGRVQLTVRHSALWLKTLGKFKKNTWKNSRTENVLSQLQEAVDMLRYAVCEHLLLGPV